MGEPAVGKPARQRGFRQSAHDLEPVAAGAFVRRAKIVRTSEAKSKIRNWFKKMRREENITQGRDALALSLIHI